ncbi:18083_t:CDS:2 [Dentiscutata erythropus]|uniref:18083_t:CDS:1 n=1 Tax=Dentiscutata erythropus TaxID=1348616 RepID=A0A9N9FCX6_9GLOM|nr:18083_t:CDS:2 [Dentiscutata erythropus]
MALPNAWNTEDKSELLSVSPDGLTVNYTGNSMNNAMIRTNCPIPPQCKLFYFEIQIDCDGDDNLIGIGFCTKEARLNNLPAILYDNVNKTFVDIERLIREMNEKSISILLEKQLTKNIQSKELVQAKNDIQQLQSEKNSLEIKILDHQQTLESTKEKLNQTKTQLKEKEKQIDELKISENQLIKHIITHIELTQKIKAKQSELEHSKSNYIKSFEMSAKKPEIEKNLKTFLNAQEEIIRLGHLKTCSANQKKDAETYLQKQRGIANLVTLGNIQKEFIMLEMQLEEELKELKKMNEKLVESMNEALEANFQMTTQYKEELNELKKADEKALKAHSTNLYKNIIKEELDQAIIQLKEKDKEIKELSEKERELCEKNKELKEKIEDLSYYLKRVEILEKTDVEIEELKVDISKTRDELEKKETEKNNLSNKLEEKNNEFEDLKNKLNNEINELKNILTEKENRINELEASKTHLISLIIRHKNLAQEIRAKQSELEQLKNNYTKTFKGFRFPKNVEFATEQKKDAESYLKKQGGFTNLDKLEEKQINLTQLEIEMEELGKLDTLKMQLKDIKNLVTCNKKEAKLNINTPSQSLTQPALTQPVQPLIIINTSGPEDAAKILQSYSS